MVSKSSVVEVPDDTPLELFAPLGCGIQTGAGAVLNSLNVSPGSSVAVFGVGSVGLSAIMAAKMRGAQTIIAVDLQPSRLEVALDIGATHAFVGSDGDVVQQIRNICQPHNGVAFALDCSGAVLVIENMIDSLATRGRAVSVGAPGPTKRVSVNVFSHLTLGRQYVGCHQGDSIASEVQYPYTTILSFFVAYQCHQMIPFLIEQQRKGLFPLEKLISHYNLDQSHQAMEDMKNGKTIKPVLRWR